MRTAIGLYGDYSPYYKKNNYKCDIFALTYDDVKDDNILIIENINNEILSLSNTNLIYKSNKTYNELKNKILDIIKKYEEENNFKYDIIILTNFRNILLEFPINNGIYTTNFEDTLNNKINSFEIISNLYIKINNQSVFLYDLDKYLLNIILNKLYNGKVILPQFLDKKEDEIIILIPSVIKTSNNTFNYVNYRSLFTHNERFNQTLEQVRSIKKYNKDISIYILEGSLLDISELDILSEYSNIILFSQHEEANNYANNNPNKSIYEVFVMKYMLEILNFKWIFKFGGRYRFHKNFNIKNFLSEKPVFKIIDKHNTYTRQEEIIECILYSLPISYKNKYINIYKTIIDEIKINSSLAIENLLYKYSDEKFRIEYLNVFGRDAIMGLDNLV